MASSLTVTPMFRQIVDDLKRLVVEGNFPDHAALPSEREVAEQHEVSRMTARRALEALEAEGLVYSKGRQGRFVSPRRLNYNVNSMRDFVLDAASQDIEVAIKLINSTQSAANADLAQRLDVEEGAKIYQTTRLFLRDGHATFLETETVVADRALALLRNSGQNVGGNPLEHRYSPLGQTADIVIRMRAVDPEEAKHLGLMPFQAGIEQEQLTRDATAHPVCLTRQIWRGELAQFSARAILQPAP